MNDRDEDLTSGVMYHVKSSLYSLGRNVLARVLDVDEAMFDGGFDELLGHFGLLLTVDGDVDNRDIGSGGHNEEMMDGLFVKAGKDSSVRSSRCSLEIRLVLSKLTEVDLIFSTRQCHGNRKWPNG